MVASDSFHDRMSPASIETAAARAYRQLCRTVSGNSICSLQLRTLADRLFERCDKTVSGYRKGQRNCEQYPQRERVPTG